jgi:hypothetical protein
MGMKLSPISRKVRRGLCVAILVMACSGSTFVLSGCDPSVSSIVLTGFQNLSTTFVDAFFTMLSSQVTGSQGTTTGTTTGTTGTST